MKAVDWCGVKTGRKWISSRKCTLPAEPSAKVSAPLLAESPVNIECKVREVVSLGTHDMFIADIVGLDVAKELLDEKGKLCLDKAGFLPTLTESITVLAKSLARSATQ